LLRCSVYSEEFDSTDFVRISSKSEFIDIESHPRDNSIECYVKIR